MLRLTSYVPEAPLPPLPANRRRFDRVPLDGVACASAVTPEGDRILTGVLFTDRSMGGFGLRSAVAIPPGSQVHLHIDGIRVPGRSGAVAYCTRDTDGAYRIGIDCAAQAAAA